MSMSDITTAPTAAKCKHGARLSLVKLRDRLGDNFPLNTIRAKLTCERCGSRAVTITFLAPDQKTESPGEIIRRRTAEVVADQG
jgi:hypothetical protein